MKKIVKVIALGLSIAAVASASATGPTMYGKIHTSVDSLDNSSTYDEWSVNSNSSRIGVKGTEDMGNGLSVGYLIEWGISSDGDGKDLNMRQRAVTINGDFGTVLAGKWDTPFKSVGRKFDAFGDQLGDVRNLTTLEDRPNNVVAYATPNLHGLTVTGAYVFDEADGKNNDAYSVNGLYTRGGIKAGVGYVKYNDNLGTDETSAWRVGGSYTMASVTILGSYTDYDNAPNSDGDKVINNDYDVWNIGGKVAVGNNTFKAQYAEKSEGISGANDGADMWSVGVDHAMSKRTTIYAAYATTSNDSDASYTSWDGGRSSPTDAIAIAGKDADALSIGIIHKF